MHPLAVADESIDIAVCQQGFQFFPDRVAAASELFRVLRPGGWVLTSTWCPVAECVFFGWICQALTKIDEPKLDAMMRLPFDYMPSTNLAAAFAEAGFVEIVVERRAADLVMSGGEQEAVTMAYATPIGPKLRALPERKRDAFHAALRRQVKTNSANGVTMGQLVAHVLKAVKPR